MVDGEGRKEVLEDGERDRVGWLRFALHICFLCIGLFQPRHAQIVYTGATKRMECTYLNIVHLSDTLCWRTWCRNYY